MADRPGVARFTRLTVVAMTSATLVVTIAACDNGSGSSNDDPTLTADQAWATYGTLPEEVTAAITEVVPDTEWELNWAPQVNEDQHAGTCVLVLDMLTTDAPLGDDGDHEAIRQAVTDAAAPYGFEDATVSSDRGYVTFRAVSDEAGTLEIVAKDRAVLRFTGIPLDPGTCDPGDFNSAH